MTPFLSGNNTLYPEGKNQMGENVVGWVDQFMMSPELQPNSLKD